MQMKPSPKVACSTNPREARVEILREFVAERLSCSSLSAAVPEAELQLVAQSASSPVAVAVGSLSRELREHGVAVRVLLLKGAGSTSGETWSQGTGFEVRYITDMRLAEAHEQLILPNGAVWTGDSMRRDVDRRDLLTSFAHDCGRVLLNARHTFSALWMRANAGQTVRRSRPAEGEVVVTSLQDEPAPQPPVRN
jgi:hypothetical protein